MTDAALSIRRPALLGLAALLALVAGFGLWATRASLVGAIVAQGQIVVLAGRHTLQHPDGGVVAEVLVRDGDRVAAGDPLLRLDGAALQSDLRLTEGRLDDLTARIARLVAERDDAPAPTYPADLLARASASPEVAAQIDGQQRLFAARRATLATVRSQLSRRIAQVQAQGDGIIAQRAALETQLALISEELQVQQSLLERGLVPQTAVLALRRESARISGQIGELAANLARTRDQVTEIEIQIGALVTQRAEQAAAELRDIGPLVLELAETRRTLRDRIARLEMRAPVAGTVLGLQVIAAQAVLRPAEPILTLVPQDKPLVVMVRIAPLQIDAVSVGQPVDLVLSAFAAADTPRLRGQVTMISADALTDPQSGAPHFLARLELAPGEAARLGGRTLLPGMPVEVYLQTGARTPLAYLLEPFTAYFSRALREG